MAGPDRNAPAHRSRLAGGILVLGGVLGIVAFLLSASVQRERAQARFDAAVAEAQDRLDARLRVCEDLLRGLRGLLQADAFLDRKRFREFVQAMDLSRRYPGLLGVSYGVPVRDGNLAAIRDRLWTEHPGLRPALHPETGFPDDAIVLFAEPEAQNAAALGFNSASSPDQRESLIEARDSGEIRASPPMPVAQALEAGPGLVLRLPIYEDLREPADVASRRAAFSGYANAVFLWDQMASDATGRLALDGVRVRLQDVTAPGNPLPFLEGGSDLPPHWWSALAPDGISQRDEVSFAGRRWRMDFTAGRSFFDPEEVWLPWIVGLASLLITGLLAALVRSVSQTGQRAQELADRMTRQLRLSESRLQAIARVMPDVILVLDEDGRYVEVHTGDPSRLTASPEHLVGRSVDQTMPPAVANQVKATIGRALERGDTQSTSYPLDTLGGHAHYEARVAPLGLEVDGKRCVIWVARDVTERDAREEAHRQAQRLEGLGLLAGGIAHDFNNLLAAIQGYLSLGRLAIADGRDPAHFLERSEASIQRAADLARQLLVYSGQAGFKVEEIDLNALVEEMGGLLAVSRSRKVALDVRLAPGLPLIHGDRAQLQQVVMNLVTNASEAIGSEAGLVELATGTAVLQPDDVARRMPGQDLAAGSFVTLMVRDDGCGMDEEILARIFDPFFTTKPTGRGLGLSAIRGILRTHHAGFEVASRLGHGTTFLLHFPVGTGTSEVARTPPPPAPERPPLSGTVLIADDEPAVRDAARMMAEHLGLTVLEAADGEGALETLQAHPELIAILVDLTMPRMGGGEVHRRVRGTRPRLPIVLCSGYSREALPPLKDPAEPTVFLQKPFSFLEMEEAIREALARAGANA